MYEARDPDDLTPEERLEAVAAILARGILRLRENRGNCRVFQPENCQESSDDSLEDSAGTVLSVTRG